LVFGTPLIEEEAIAEVIDCLRSSWIGKGPRVANLEDLMRSYLDTSHAVALSSGFAGLHLALLAAGIERGDEVITTPITFPATVNAILHTGATPVFADVDRRTHNIDPDQVAAAITPASKAILPVHLAGRPCDMDAIHQVATDHGLAVIEDAAHALGADYHGRKVGTLSTATVFSLYATKNATTGEGGVVTTADRTLAQQVAVLASHGLSSTTWERFGHEGPSSYQAVAPGFNYQLTDIQASIGLHQLPLLDHWRSIRERIWERYDEGLADLPLELPPPPARATVHARHLYTVLVDGEGGPDRDGLRSIMHSMGIGTGVHFIALHLQPAFRSLTRSQPLPNAEWVSGRTLSLPVGANLTADDVDDVIAALRSIFKQG
jgi:dTDP-4-amino-4,6-dideoxygalactose transaminase